MDNILSISRIKRHYDSLNDAERRVADIVLKDWQRVIGMPIAEIAREADTSQTTVVRFSRAIGFKGFAEFKMSLSSGRLSPEANIFAMSGDESDAVVAQMTARFNRDAMVDAAALVDSEQLTRAADVLNSAKRVAVIGEGGAASSARCAYEIFMHIGVPCILVEDAMYQIMAISRLGKDDAVLAISHSGRDRSIVENMREAKKRGATTIALVGIKGSSIAKYTDILLNTGMYDHQFFSETLTARICEMNLISSLHALVSFRRQGLLTDHRQAISDLFDVKRLKK